MPVAHRRIYCYSERGVRKSYFSYKNMTFFDAMVLGVVEGITEFLPVSSTGHLILTANLLQLRQTDFLKMFEVVIQLGAILSIVALYAKKVLTNFMLIKKLSVAMVPALVVGGTLYPLIKALFESEMTIVWALFLGGVMLIMFELLHAEREDAVREVADISYGKAFWVGMFQTFAVIPGVSRSGATIVGGLWLGLSRTAIVEFSFLLAVPTMLAASVLDLYKNGGSATSSEWGLLGVGFMTAFAVSLVVVKWLLKFVQTNTFIAFGAYRIVAALVFFMLVV